MGTTGAGVLFRWRFAVRLGFFALIVSLVQAGEPVFHVGYYPYHQKLRARANLTQWKDASAVTGARFVLTQKDNTNELASARASVVAQLPRHTRPIGPYAGEGRFIEAILDTPDLAGGAYVVTMVPHDANGEAKGEFQAAFERIKWEWEHNDIGLSRVVVPPFTPLKVRGRVVESVLREHTINRFGLWDRVRSKGEDILAGPMRFEGRVRSRERQFVDEARAEGHELTFAATKALGFTEKSDDRVVVESEFKGGPLRANVTSEFDYDGMMKVTVDLHPLADARGYEISSLTLLIPLKERVAQLMHISGDSIRQNYAGKVPPGKGVVWESKGANGTRAGYGAIWGTFMPYVWLGGTERGLCWFADTDRDWSLDDDKSALDIVRGRGAVTLRVHLFNKPTVLDRPRRIVFGLQATPVKPMPAPENGITWRGWNFYNYTNAVVHSILAQTQIWGGEEADCSVYPRKRDFAIFEEMARGRRVRNMHMGWVDASGWLDGYTRQEKRAEYRSDVIAGFSTAGSADYVIPYFNPRGSEDSELMEEALNYCPRPLLGNEWNEPVRSWQDFALFYLRKMVATEAVHGVYYDNVYATANHDTVSGDAYVRPDGALQPSMGIFNLRELLKRTATMFHEMGKKPVIVAHMTNANLLPILSFATFCLDFEDKYGATDFQARWSTDFILTEAIGLQGGMVPAGLGGMTSDDPQETKRLSRTFFGVALVHEIRPWGYYDLDELHRANMPLYEFGYGLEDCKVWRYWDAGQPVRIEGGSAKALVLAREGKALVLVADFGDGGEVTLKVNAKSLGVSSPFTVMDVQTGEKLKMDGKQIRFPLKRHDYRIVRIE
jgi:hypothetical protein